jgi:cytochrome oxidase Cu insertion factor (SCO1/SenC/PrrC family)
MMRKTKLWAFLGLVLAIGLIAACGGDNNSDTPQIKNAKLEVGDEAPDFRLPDHKGGFVRLSDLKGKSNAVIAFFPAAFTPV